MYVDTIKLPAMTNGVRDLLSPYGVHNQVWDAQVTPDRLQFYTHRGLVIRVNRGEIWAETTVGDMHLKQGDTAVLCGGSPAILYQRTQGRIPPAQITFAYLDTADPNVDRTTNLRLIMPTLRLITEELVCTGIRLDANETRALPSTRTTQFLRALDGSATLVSRTNNQAVQLDGLEVVSIEPATTVDILARVNGVKIDVFTMRR